MLELALELEIGLEPEQVLGIVTVRLVRLYCFRQLQQLALERNHRKYHKFWSKSFGSI